MLDAFIIDTMQKQNEQNDWKPAPLTLELPVSEQEQAEKEEEREKDKKRVTLKF